MAHEPTPPAAGRPNEYAGSWAALTATLAIHAIASPRLGVDLIRTAWAFRLS